MATPFERIKPDSAETLLSVFRWRVIISHDPMPRIVYRLMNKRVIDKYTGDHEYLESNVHVMGLSGDFIEKVMNTAAVLPEEAGHLKAAYNLWRRIGQPDNWRVTVYQDYEGVKNV